MARRSREIRSAQAAETNCGERHAEREHRCANCDVRGGDIGRLVTPNHPGAEHDLASEKEKPKVGEAGEHARVFACLARKKKRRDYTGGDNYCRKPVEQL